MAYPKRVSHSIEVAGRNVGGTGYGLLSKSYSLSQRPLLIVSQV